MDHLLGLLKVRVLRGVGLAIRDVRSSDPYVVVMMGSQKLKTRVVKDNINPEWNEELTLSVEDPILPIKIEVYEKDTFSSDDPMGFAEFSIEPFVEAVKMNNSKLDIPDGTIISKMMPCRQNWLSKESTIYWLEGKISQNLLLRLRDVECGEIELQLEWVSIPGSKAL